MRPVIGLLRRFNTNLHLRDKLFIMFLLVAIIPTTFIILYSYQSIKSELTAQTYNNMNHTLNQLSKNMDNKLNSYSQISSLFYLDIRLRDYITHQYDNHSMVYDAHHYINTTIASMLALHTGLENITIYTANETLPSDGLYVKHLEQMDPEFQLEATTPLGYPIYGPVHLSAKGNNVITLARSLTYLSLNFPYGILTIDIKEQDLYELMEEENNNRDIYIVDEKWNILITKDKERIGANLFQIAQPPDAAPPVSASYDSMVDGQKVLVMHNALMNGWHTVAIIPYHDFLNNAQNATARLFMISAVSIVAAIILIYMTSKLFTKRIENLLGFIRKMERENFDLEIKPMGHDEVGQLAFAFKKMAYRIRELIYDVYKKEIEQKEAELNTLQAQINPHFLYNTLGAISSLALKHQDLQMHDLVTHLAKFYRVSLNKGKKVISVGQEIELTRHYIHILEMRFKDMFQIYYQLDESLFKYQTIKLILQPFIENCINHAVWNTEAALNIIIRITSQDDNILLEVIDDGIGMNQKQIVDALQKADSNGGYGSKNVNDRLKLAFGEEYGVEIFSRPGIGTHIKLTIPKRMHIS
ncbi:sensor histidine kinase [Paenibacillaceae bacterium]|nr:sensor histidine kinase [Paenibacillaceae bacterium]